MSDSFESDEKCGFFIQDVNHENTLEEDFECTKHLDDYRMMEDDVGRKENTNTSTLKDDVNTSEKNISEYRCVNHNFNVINIHQKESNQFTVTNKLAIELTETETGKYDYEGCENKVVYSSNENKDNYSKLLDEKDSKSKECNQVMKIRNNIFPSNGSLKSPASGSSNSVKTLEEALKYFGLLSRLEELEKSLENVRNHKKNKEEHELYLKQFDKELQKLSFKYHPDKVKSRKGSTEEMEEAKTLQTALNATRTVLSFLNQKFLEDLDIDHKFGFYSKLNISSCGNEEEIENRVYEVLFKISLMSEIKQQNIVAEIRKFMTESRNCIKSYIEGNESGFDKYWQSAVYHFQKCITGYEKLLKEYEAVEKDFGEDNFVNATPAIIKLGKENSKHLKILKQLGEVVSHSSDGSFKLFYSCCPIDEYFVLPFVLYINLILMCKAVRTTKTKSFWNYFLRIAFLLVYKFIILIVYIICYIVGFPHFFKEVHDYPEPMCHFDVPYFDNAYYLVQYYNGQKRYKCLVNDNNLRKEHMKEKFIEYVKKISEFLEDKFKIEDYNEKTYNKYAMEELNNCMEMMNSFQNKAEKLLEDIKEFKSDSQKMREECQQIRKEREDFSEKLKKRLEESKAVRETFAASIFKNSE